MCKTSTKIKMKSRKIKKIVIKKRISKGLHKLAKTRGSLIRDKIKIIENLTIGLKKRTREEEGRDRWEEIIKEKRRDRDKDKRENKDKEKDSSKDKEKKKG
jgi:ABC-type branched-subunit amino acid transport system ATPase component